MKEFQVMKATAGELSDFRFPAYASPKVDGFRGYVQGAQLRARSNKRIANRATELFFSNLAFEGLDGELVVGSPISKTLFQTTTSALRSEDGDPQATYLIFDYVDISGRMPFVQRQVEVDAILSRMPAKYAGRVVKLTQMLVHSLDELLEFEERCLSLGFEGVMVRSPNGPYKQGRSTVNEGALLKLKRFVDSEAMIIGREEEQEGGTKRLKGTLGAFIVRDLVTGVEFNIGSGFTAEQRREFWRKADAMNGEIAKYKFFPVGTKTAPRHPTFIGLRAAVDM